MLGNSTGILLHTFAVSLGLSTLYLYYPIIHSHLKWFGVFYLAFLSAKILLTTSSLQTTRILHNKNLALIYKDGVLVNLLNPKTFLLMLALLPQFVIPDNDHVPLQMGLLGLVHITMASVVLTTLCLSIGKLANSIPKSWVVQKLFRWLSAGLLFVFAVKLAISN